MSSSFMADIGAMGAEAITAKKSTSRANNTEMKMEDFLKLMVVQLQSQTIDDTADTGEMLNQLVQMQMVTALSNMTDASVMSYASSLVGKEVTIGYVDKENNLHEEVLNVIGTGLYDGQQVIFCDDGKMYQLSQIMAVGHIPDLKKGEETEDPEEAEQKRKLNAMVDDTIDKINSRYYDYDNQDSETGNDAVSGADTGNTAENSTETETETNDGTTDQLKDLPTGLLKDMLVPPPNKTDKADTGEQVEVTNET